MKCKKFFAFYCLLVLTGASVALAGGSPFDVGNKSQLFVDRVLVRSAEGISFTLHPARKHPENPLVKAEASWEGWRLEIYGNVIYDEDEHLFKMWYMCESPKDFPHYAVLYATSQDGVHWDKPLVGTIKSLRGGQHNAVADGYLLASVMKDKADPNPDRRYKMICWRQKPTHGPHTMVSPDGLNWTQLSEKPICRSSDVITGYYDETRKLYVAFPKLNTKVRGHVRRCFGITTSKDFLTWTEPRYAFKPDLRDDAGSLARIEQVRPILDVPDNPGVMRTEFYGVGVYVAESCTLAFPWVFTINNNARYGNQEGPGELQLAVSRDLVEWERPFREPVVPRGKLDEWDRGFFTTQSRALRVGDEVWLYYGGSTYTHGTPCLYRPEGTGRKTEHTGSIGLAIWQLDRFVSADAPAEGAELTTVPIVYSGQRLEINAATKPGGQIVIDMLDVAGKPIAEAKPVKGDDLRHAVDFGGDSRVSSLVSSWAGKPIVLRFRMKNAELFAFAFRD